MRACDVGGQDAKAVKEAEKFARKEAVNLRAVEMDILSQDSSMQRSRRLWTRQAVLMW